MNVSQHVISSIPLGLAVLAGTGDAPAAAVAVAATILIDADHYLDQLVEFRRFVSLSEARDTYRRSAMRLAFLPFHGWEQTLLLAAGAWITGEAVLIGLAAGVAWHLSLDNYYWRRVVPRARPGFYFFIYRASRRFEAVRLMSAGHRLGENGGR